MKTVITMTDGHVDSITQDGKNVYGSFGGAPAANGSASTAPAPAASVIEEMARRRPTALNWRYPNRAALEQAVPMLRQMAEADPTKRAKIHRVVFVNKGGTETTLEQGTVAADAKPVRYIEQADGSVIYETYLDQVNAQGTGERRDILPAYNDRAEMLNDLKAIKFQQIVELDGVRVWPPAGEAGFGPALPYVTSSSGGIVSGTNPDGTIHIESFDK